MENPRRSHGLVLYVSPARRSPATSPIRADHFFTLGREARSDPRDGPGRGVRKSVPSQSLRHGHPTATCFPRFNEQSALQVQRISLGQLLVAR